jgi:hypothetical protein
MHENVSSDVGTPRKRGAEYLFAKAGGGDDVAPISLINKIAECTEKWISSRNG